MLCPWSHIREGERRLGHARIVREPEMNQKRKIAIAYGIGEPEMAWLPDLEEFTPDHRKYIGRLFQLGRQIADDPSAADRVFEEPPEIAETLEACGEPLVGGTEKTKRSRAEQSRINGAKSRGPKTIDGKLAARMNALRHGLRSRLGMLPDEYADEYRAFIADVVAELTPTTLLQRELARRVADLSWRLRRMPLVERHLVEGEMPKSMDDIEPAAINERLCDQIVGEDAELPKLQRYATTLERSIRSCLRELRQLQGAGATVNAGAAREVGVGTEMPAVAAIPPAVPATAPVPPAKPRPAAPPPVAPAAAAPPVPVGGSKPTDGMRFSGSFGATLMPMATIPLVPMQGAAAVPGSFGKTPRPGPGTMPPVISNDIAPFGTGA